MTHHVGRFIAMLNNLPTQRITSALKFLAIDSKLSQSRLADKAGMSQSAVNRRLAGETSITLEDLDHMAAAMGYTVSVTFEAVAR